MDFIQVIQHAEKILLTKVVFTLKSGIILNLVDFIIYLT